MSLFRPTATQYGRRLCFLVALCLGLLGFTSASATAAKNPPPPKAPKVKPASDKKNAQLAVCPGQTFSRPFEAFDDSNYYTLVDGSEFDEGPEGWELANGAEVVEEEELPDGSTGGVLNLPSGAYAISPPVCVTLQYPTARSWSRTIEGDGGISVGVRYAGSKSDSGNGKKVGQLDGKVNDGWKLSHPFNVQPQITGSEEGIREVRFTIANTTKDGLFQFSGLYVDPRMR
jgi:hypothetical protein